MAVIKPPYRNNQDWDALISEVNAVLENPVGDGCEPIDPIEHVPPRYRWGKSDLREMQEKIKETCPDISFEPIPEGHVRWSKRFIDEIRDSLEQAWCECENEFNSCPGCGPIEINQFYSDPPKSQTCPLGSAGGCPIEPADVEADVEEFAWQAHENLFLYLDEVGNVCRLRDDVTIKERQIEDKIDDIELQESLIDAACGNDPEGDSCAEAQAQLEVLQDELAILEAELEALQEELATATTARDDFRAACEDANNEAITLLSTMSRPAMTPAPSNLTDEFIDACGIRPWGDDIEKCKAYGTSVCMPRYSLQLNTQLSPSSSFSERWEDFFTPGGTAMIPPDSTAYSILLATWGSVCFSSTPETSCPPTTIENDLLYRVVIQPPPCNNPPAPEEPSEEPEEPPSEETPPPSFPE